MRPPDPEDEALRRAFTLPADSPPQAECPPPEEVWSASRGELPAARTQELLAHSALCPACAESWQWAAALGAEAGGVLVESGLAVAAPHRFRIPAGMRLGLGLAAAAASIAVLALLVPWRRPPDEFRDVGSFSIASRLETGRALPRDACVLSWSGGPRGTLYSVEVARPDLTVIARADQIETNHYQVPASVLAGLPAGSAVLWRVEAVLPDATRVSSPVFRAKLE
jgi:hypothetical protein